MLLMFVVRVRALAKEGEASWPRLFNYTYLLGMLKQQDTRIDVASHGCSLEWKCTSPRGIIQRMGKDAGWSPNSDYSLC